jgi:predicted HTH transcriptional regulator
VNPIITNQSTVEAIVHSNESQSQDQQLVEKQSTEAEALSEVEQEKRYAKTERQHQLLELLRYVTREADVEVDKLADRFKVSSQTIYRDLADLKAQNRLRIEDSAIRVIG